MFVSELSQPPRRRRPRLCGLHLVREPGVTAPMTPAGRRRQLANPREVAAFLMPFAERELVEVFWLLPLDVQHRLLFDEPVEVTRGTVNNGLVHPREVFRAAIVAGASAIIVAHNHPSGDVRPSSDDRFVTLTLVAAGRALDIPTNDHVIVGAGRYYSFAEDGAL